MKKYITIRFEFDETVEDDYAYYNLVALERVGCDFAEDDIISLQEGWAQSDYFWVETCSTLISALEPGRKEIRP